MPITETQWKNMKQNTYLKSKSGEISRFVTIFENEVITKLFDGNCYAEDKSYFVNTVNPIHFTLTLELTDLDFRKATLYSPKRLGVALNDDAEVRVENEILQAYKDNVKKTAVKKTPAKKAVPKTIPAKKTVTKK